MRVFSSLFLAAAVAASPKDLPVVEIHTPAVFAPMDRAFYPARQVASEIFLEIGLKLLWRMPAATPSCSLEPSHSQISIAISWNTPVDLHPEALAFSKTNFTDGACVTLFLDRVKPMLAGRPTTTTFLLGHVVAHELGHVLQGLSRHSETGVLKERWSEAEIQNMPNRRLSFTPYDAHLIINGLCRRR